MPFRSLAAVRWRANLEAFRRCGISSRPYSAPCQIRSMAFDAALRTGVLALKTGRRIAFAARPDANGQGANLLLLTSRTGLWDEPSLEWRFARRWHVPCFLRITVSLFRLRSGPRTYSPVRAFSTCRLQERFPMDSISAPAQPTARWMVMTLSTVAFTLLFNVWLMR